MAEGLKFSLTLLDGITGPSKDAAASLKTLQTTLGTAKSSLSSYQQQLTKAKALGDIEGYRRYSDLVQTSRRSVFDLTQQVEAAGGSQKTFSTSILGTVSALKGQLAAAASVAAGLAAVGFALYEVGKSAVTTALEVEGVNRRLESTFAALGRQGPESGKKTMAFLNELSGRLPQSRDELARWTKTYEAMGVSDLGELRHQLLATASAQAIMGDSGAEAYQKIAERVNLAVEGHHGLKLAEKSLKALYEAGVNEADIAAKMGLSVEALSAGLKAGSIDAQAFGNAMSTTLVEKGKGPLAAMGSELGTLRTKASEVFGHLFDGIDTAPLTDAIRSVIRMGELGTPSGKALAGGIRSGVNDVIKTLGHMVTEGQVIFLTLELYAIRWGVTGHRVVEGVKIGLGALVVMAGLLAAPLLLAVAPMALFAAAVTAAWHAAQGLKAALTGIGSKGGHGHSLDMGPTTTLTAPAHASGGIVQPASGEMFASVAPGEMILPARESRQMSRSSFAAVGQRDAQDAPGGTNGGIHVDRILVNIQAPEGITDAHALSVTGLTVALERLQLAAGR